MFEEGEERVQVVKSDGRRGAQGDRFSRVEGDQRQGKGSRGWGESRWYVKLSKVRKGEGSGSRGGASWLVRGQPKAGFAASQI